MCLGLHTRLYQENLWFEVARTRSLPESTACCSLCRALAPWIRDAPFEEIYFSNRLGCLWWNRQAIPRLLSSGAQVGEPKQEEEPRGEGPEGSRQGPGRQKEGP